MNSLRFSKIYLILLSLCFVFGIGIWVVSINIDHYKMDHRDTPSIEDFTGIQSIDGTPGGPERIFPDSSKTNRPATPAEVAASDEYNRGIAKRELWQQGFLAAIILCLVLAAARFLWGIRQNLLPARGWIAENILPSDRRTIPGLIILITGLAIHSHFSRSYSLTIDFIEWLVIVSGVALLIRPALRVVRDVWQEIER